MRYDRKCGDCIFLELLDLSGRHCFCNKLKINVPIDRIFCSKFKSIYQPLVHQLSLFDLDGFEL